MRKTVQGYKPTGKTRKGQVPRAKEWVVGTQNRFIDWVFVSLIELTTSVAFRSLRVMILALGTG